ncbi:MULTISPECIES: oligopeptide ABC transporter permease [unclassified Streptococcus]|uniref:oligopeptide ABC transporter permease n=1 Tax=unclassified Streptococcus TaxID=2608887 RepID=UPI001072E5D8|nr:MULTISPECIES: oligopeptide ABC transporter permease [unclassified Streptococcus]MBF0805790.1 ABC transporter permease [Streptococcus sp. 19428wA2_WM07]TFU28640.1 ABC transporter permease [Streptococcus sp. WM07]
MWKVIIRRFLIMIPQLLLLSIIVFALAKLMPGDPFSGLAENPKISPEQIELIRQRSGFYKPWYEQYYIWLNNFLHGDFGLSYITGKSVGTVIGERIFNTLNLSLFTLIVTYLIAIPLGMYSGRYQNSKLDKFVGVYSFLAIAIPSFVLYLFMILIFGFQLSWFPTSGSVDIGLEPGTLSYYLNKLYHLVLPGTTIALLSAVTTIQYLRNEVIEAKQSDYVKTARAKGVPIGKIYSDHIFRNSLLPIAAFFGFTITGLFSGAIIAETIFGYPGMGQLFVQSMESRDYSVVVALMLFSGFLTLVGSALSDIIMAIVDPRIKLD